MFLYFTPFTFIFLCVYLLFIFFILTIQNVYFFWLFIEMSILLFIGLSYTIFINSFTQLILYFLIQTLASFSLLVFYIYGLFYLIYFSFFLKLGIFPFISWYLNVLFRFPTFILFLSTTLHKLPPLFLFVLLYNSNYSNFIFVSVLFSLLVGGFYIINIIDLRYLIIVSSIANNGFILIRLISGSLIVFIIFYTIYSLNIFIIFYLIGMFLKSGLSLSRSDVTDKLIVMVILLNIAALPPFPMFFAKFFILFSYLLEYNSSFFVLILLVLTNVRMMVSYCYFFIKYFTQKYSNMSNFLLF